jgi:hypothetical protein
MQAGDGEAFGARELLAARRLAIAPLGAGARVEQHARDHEVDRRARALHAMGRALEAVRGRERRPSIDSAGLEVPPAAVDGDLEAWIALADHVHDVRGDRRHALFLPAEVRRAPLDRRAGDLAAMAAHRVGGEQRRGGTRRGHEVLGALAGDHSSSPRPCGDAGASADGGSWWK